MRAAIGLASLALGLMLAGCQTAPENAAGAAPVAVQGQRCDGRETTGSRLARCDRSDVRVISGEEIRRSGVPTSGGSAGTPTN